MQRTASVDWTGSLREGQGKISSGSGALREIPYAYSTRFGEREGINPEELVAAAHSSCFTMALAAELAKAKLKADALHTDATVTLQVDQTGYSVANIHLAVWGEVPGATSEQFEAAARTAKDTCPMSRLMNTEITLHAELRGAEAKAA